MNRGSRAPQTMVLWLLLAACPGRKEAPPPTGAAAARVAPAAAPYLPLKVGARSTFLITRRDGTRVHKTSTVEAHDRSLNTFRVRTVKTSGDVTVTWERELGGVVVVDREQTSYAVADGAVEEREERWEPAKVRLDARPERLVAGARWKEQYTETRRYSSGVEIPLVWKKTWTVEAVDDPVVVPAGTFRCLRVHIKATARFDPKRTITTKKTYWYAPGVGKVKEVGGQTEELAAYGQGPLITAAAR